MTVAELKELHPVENVYELKPDCRYLIKIPSHFTRDALEATVKGLGAALKEVGVKGLIAASNDIIFYELKD